MAHVTLGLRFYYAGQTDLAITAYEKALELNPGYPSAHYLLSLVYLAKSQPLQALAELPQQLHGATWERLWLTMGPETRKRPKPG